MIISHKHKFIFLKTRKTAGTSIEVFLQKHCGEKDVVTPIYGNPAAHNARNYRGWFNPLPELMAGRNPDYRRYYKAKTPEKVLGRFIRRKKYYNHIHANDVKLRVGKKIWNEYYKFSIERNPWDKTLSQLHWRNHKRDAQQSIEEYFEEGAFCINYPIYTDRYNNNTLMVDRVINYDNLNDEFGEICEHLGLPYDGKLQAREKSDLRTDKRSYKEVLSDEQKKKIGEIFSKEIELHGFHCE